MNYRETFKAKVNETLSKNSLGIHTDRNYVCIHSMYRTWGKGDFSAFFQKNRKEKHMIPVSKIHISLNCVSAVLLVK